MRLNAPLSQQNLPESTGFDPLPAGWYFATITESELKTTKAGNGEYISIKYEVTGPTHQGRGIYSMLNIRNPNPKAEEIGLGQLRSLMAAINLNDLQDTDQLLGGSLQIKLNVKRDEEYGDKNEVKQYKALSTVMPSQSSSMPMPPQPSATPGNIPQTTTSFAWAKPQQTPAQQPPAPSTDFDDDIPFDYGR
jgi:hypothetical protein